MSTELDALVNEARLHLRELRLISTTLLADLHEARDREDQERLAEVTVAIGALATFAAHAMKGGPLTEGWKG